MDLEIERTEILDEPCDHDWRMEPAWRLVSRGQCHKCKSEKTVLNNPVDEEPVPKRRPRRKKPAARAEAE